MNKVVRLAPERKRRLARQRRSTQAALVSRSDPRLAWYLGLGLMAALEVIDRPVRELVGSRRAVGG